MIWFASAMPFARSISISASFFCDFDLYLFRFEALLGFNRIADRGFYARVPCSTPALRRV